jgi:hypothetical protein
MPNVVPGTAITERKNAYDGLITQFSWMATTKGGLAMGVLLRLSIGCRDSNRIHAVLGMLEATTGL